MVYFVTDLKDKIKLQGRSRIKNNLFMFDYSASGFEFKATCGGNIKITFIAKNIPQGELGGCYFTVFVDGERLARDFCRITSNGKSEFVIAENLKEKEHTIRVYRQTECEWGEVGLESIELSSQPYPVPPSDKYIEFIGDSITTSFGNLTNNGDESFRNPIHQDATLGYAFLTATELNADFSLVARQGIGASVGYQPIPMQSVYPFICQLRDEKQFDFSRQPNINLIALGTNDINAYNNEALGNNKTLAEVKQGFAEFLKLVRKHNPKSKIVWMHGMMTDRASKLIEEVISEAGGISKGYYTVKVTQDNAGGQGHPHCAGHRKIADDLKRFLKTIM